MTSSTSAIAPSTLQDQPQITRLIQSSQWPWVIGILVSFALLHSVIIEQSLRIAFQSISIPDELEPLSDHWLPLRWFYILRFGLTGSWDPNWSHVLFVPFISLYFVGQKKHEILLAPKRLYWPGLYLAMVGMLSYSAGLYPIKNDMARGYSMVLTLFGIVLFLLGPKPMRYLWFPIFYLVFAVKISDRVWSLVASSLQGIVSQGGFFTLEVLASFLDFRVNLRGHTLEVIPIGERLPQSLNVAEACSGMRSLMTFVVLGTAMAFLGTRPIWQRVLLLASIPFVAIGMNIARITALGLLTAYGQHEMAHGDFHTFIGLLMLIPAAGTFALIGWILTNIFIDQDRQAAPQKHSEISISPQTTSSNTQYQLKTVLPGMLSGVSVGLLVFGIYLCTIFAFRPDLIGDQIKSWMALVASTTAIVLLIFTIIASKKSASSATTNSNVFACSLVICMLLAATSIQGAVIGATEFVLIKNPVPLRKPLESIPTEIGSWTLVEREPRLSPEIQDELGTDQYVTLIYEDLDWPSNQPGGRIRLHVPYYTGTVDTVPHVPDRCFVAGGAIDSEIRLVKIELDSARSKTDPASGLPTLQLQNGQEVRLPSILISATRFRYRQPAMKTVDNELSTVFYFFAANGRFLATPELVRAQGFDPRDKYAYFSKVEVQPLPQLSSNGQWKQLTEHEALARSKAFLTQALPEIMACLPDWHEVQKGLWPPQNKGNEQ